jgi:hypothetical protein
MYLFLRMLRFPLNNRTIDSEKETVVLFFLNTQLDWEEDRYCCCDYVRTAGKADRGPT